MMKNRKILWFALWLFSLIVVSFRGGAAAYGFFFFCTLVPIICLLYLLAVVIEFSIYQEIGSRVVTAGEPFTYNFTLMNEGWITISSIKVQMYADFSTVEELPEGITFELLPGEDFRFATKMICKYRGEIRVGVAKLQITDFLKMFTITYRVKEPLEAIVDPRIPDEDEYARGEEFAQAFRQENRQKKEVPDFTVREYIAGDSLRRIHWNASATVGKLMTRELTGEEQERVTVLVDAGRYSREEKEYLPVENHILELVLALVQHFCLKSRPVTVAFLHRVNGRVLRKEREIVSLQEFSDYYEEVKKFEFLSSLKPEERALLFDHNNVSGTVFAVLAEIGEQEEKALEELANIGAEIEVISAKEGVEL